MIRVYSVHIQRIYPLFGVPAKKRTREDRFNLAVWLPYGNTAGHSSIISMEKPCFRRSHLGRFKKVQNCFAR